MTAKWGSCIVLMFFLAMLAVGCRTTQPDVKPPKERERLVSPPPGTLEQPGYPKAAFDAPANPLANFNDMKNLGPGGRGGMMPSSGMSGVGGAGRPY
ncbi:MAG: hypothetical protein HYX68_10555 [Planctomycetes bacterium]|nr:hypothetical protein [Planctomycetota bacterium]